MATPTYELIETTTLSSNTSTVSFSNIPQTYRDLVLVMNISGVSTNYHNLRYNDDTGANYSCVVMGGAAQSYEESGMNRFIYGQLAVTMDADPVLHIHQCLDYSATDKHKAVLDRLGQKGSSQDTYCCSFASTDAVTKIDVFPNTGNIASGSTLSLYGIAG